MSTHWFHFFLAYETGLHQTEKGLCSSICRNSLQTEALSPLTLMKRVTQGSKMDVLCLHVVISCMFSATNNVPMLASVFLGSCAFFLIAKLLGMTLKCFITANHFMTLFPNFEYHLSKHITAELFVYAAGIERKSIVSQFQVWYWSLNEKDTLIPSFENVGLCFVYLFIRFLSIY